MAPLLVAAVAMVSVTADTFVGGPATTFVPKRSVLSMSEQILPVLQLRGGATAAASATTGEDEIEFESSDEDLDESEEVDDEVTKLDPKLAKATQQKAATIKTKMAKQAVEAAVKPQKKKSSSSLVSLLHIPYIIKACLNPFVFWKMTRGYWASLTNLDYLAAKVDSSQDLRSALEEKAKKSGGSPRGKRRFKPGQAKVRKHCLNFKLILETIDARLTWFCVDSVGPAATQHLRLRKECLQGDVRADLCWSLHIPRHSYSSML